MQETKVRSYRSGGFEFLALENRRMRAVFLPEVGNKMVELTNLETGKQYLLGPQSPDRLYTRPTYGADFAAFDTSGFDECFPTVATSPYRSLSRPDRRYDFEFPDHGELWSRPWEFSNGDASLRFRISGVKAAYEFEKLVSLRDNTLTLRYTLRNRWTEPLSFLWSAHPLLDVRPGMRILLPSGIREMLLNWASDSSVGAFGDRIPWPNLHPGRRGLDFADIQDPALGLAVKCFTDRISSGCAALYDRVADESLLITFDPEENPYLGIWLCYGGWPEHADRKHLTVAIEPCNGRPDSLEEAVRRKECSEVPAGGERSWSIRLSVWRGHPPEPSLR